MTIKALYIKFKNKK